MYITYAKIILYLTEYHLMRFIAKIRGWPIPPLPKFSKKEKQALNFAFKDLLKSWKLMLKEFPEVNKISSPWAHLKRYILLIKDLNKFLVRKNLKDSHDLKQIHFDKNCPEYFKRNYHFQTDGYFSFDSAGRYDHQIELLFLGTAHIMRKVAYSVLNPILKKNEEVLEFGAGSGTSGAQFKQLFPNVNLDILEPGAPYLEYAQSIYPASFNKLVNGFMETFESQKKYGCIFSCFVMHEIPVSYWDSIIVVIKKSLKPGGHVLIVDSQQNCDKLDHQFALDQFAEDYFEPYFEEFRNTPLEGFFQQNGFELVEKKEVLFSKSLLFKSLDLE